MAKKRRQYSPEFKAKVAIAAIRGEETSSDLSDYYDIHPSLLNSWKRYLLENASQLFARGKTSSRALEVETSGNEIDELYRQIGRLTVERDLLAEQSLEPASLNDSLSRYYFDRCRH